MRGQGLSLFVFSKNPYHFSRPVLQSEGEIVFAHSGKRQEEGYLPIARDIFIFNENARFEE